ncbi:uncharacterized protein LOC142178437 isoform X2 [Nicotiana tabacum]|uniref:Uncharacterized protein LOC142178437 isoform X2 n=2 Tax=Nicotiana tabacum TaxID=4097 RepID=A0AC58U3F0_TOBAC
MVVKQMINMLILLLYLGWIIVITCSIKRLNNNHSHLAPHKLDWKTGKTIGTGYESQGLYHMYKSQPPVAFTSATSVDLLHSRLFHPSLAKLQKLIPNLSTLSSFECQNPYHLPLKVFGCTCFVHDHSPGSDKLQPKSIKCVFLGYPRY